jgi:hypothetical protein
VEPSVIDTVAKYFYFSTLDDRLSFAASLKVLAELRASDSMDSKHRARWVMTLTKWRRRLPSIHPRSWAGDPEHSGFQIPAEFDMGAWMTFVSSSEPSEVEAVLLSQVLGFTDQEIATGLDVTVGTVRYRLGRGLRHLGGFVEY